MALPTHRQNPYRYPTANEPLYTEDFEWAWGVIARLARRFDSFRVDPKVTALCMYLVDQKRDFEERVEAKFRERGWHRKPLIPPPPTPGEGL